MEFGDFEWVFNRLDFYCIFLLRIFTVFFIVGFLLKTFTVFFSLSIFAVTFY